MFSPDFQGCRASCFIGLAAVATQRCCPLRSAVGISRSLQSMSSEGPRRGEDNQASFVGKNSGMKGFFKEQESPSSQAMFTGMITGLTARTRRSKLACVASLGPLPIHGTLQALPPHSPAQISWQDYFWWKSVSLGGMCVPPPCSLLGLSQSKYSSMVHL